MRQNERIKDAKVLVTGASGFIGSALSKRLLKCGAIVYGNARKEIELDKNIIWKIGDLTDFEFVDELIKEINPDYIFHLASLVVGSRSQEYVLPTFRNNLLSTVNLLSAANNNKCKRIILAGSSEEPNSSEEMFIPASPYASAKIASSNYARMFYNLYKTPVSIAKIFMVYGPGQKDFTKLLPYVILNTLMGKSPEVSSGERLIDWIYIDDVVEGLIQMTDLNFNIDGKLVDLGSGKFISIKDITSLTIQLINPQIKALFGAVKDRPFEQSRTANVERTYQQIKWRPATLLKEGLMNKIDFYYKIHQKGKKDNPGID